MASVALLFFRFDFNHCLTFELYWIFVYINKAFCSFLQLLRINFWRDFCIKGSGINDEFYWLSLHQCFVEICPGNAVDGLNMIFFQFWFAAEVAVLVWQFFLVGIKRISLPHWPSKSNFFPVRLSTREDASLFFVLLFLFPVFTVVVISLYDLFSSTSQMHLN